MNFKTKHIFISFLLISSINFSHAQTHDLSDSEIQDFKERTGHMIDRFQKNLSIIGSKKKTFNTKKMFKKQTLKMVLGNGEPYEDSYGNYQPEVHMQVSSVRNGIQTKRNIALKKYLDRLMRISYARVDITQAETFRLSNIYKVGDHYEAVATIFQKFCGYGNDGRKRYCDVTRKTIKIYVIPEHDMYGTHWTVKFGNIDVAETMAR